MKIIKKISLAFVLVYSFKTLAQNGTIVTDRPSQSDGTSIVAKRKLQLEEGVRWGKETAINSFVLRYGMGKTTEIRVVANAGKYMGATGLQPVTFSLKQKFLEGGRWLPATALVGYISYGKLASKNFQDEKVLTEIKLAFENKLPQEVTLFYNFGTSENFQNLDLKAGFSYAPLPKLNVFLEYFGTYNRRAPQHNADAGILYLAGKNIQLDVAMAHSLFNPDEKLMYTTAGISYLFN